MWMEYGLFFRVFYLSLWMLIASHTCIRGFLVVVLSSFNFLVDSTISWSDNCAMASSFILSRFLSDWFTISSSSTLQIHMMWISFQNPVIAFAKASFCSLVSPGYAGRNAYSVVEVVEPRNYRSRRSSKWNQQNIWRIIIICYGILSDEVDIPFLWCCCWPRDTSFALLVSVLSSHDMACRNISAHYEVE